MPEVRPSPTTTGALAMRVLQDNSAAFLEHAPGARASEHPEHVHQMRVATRRLRAALRVFEDVVPTEATSLNDDLAWIASQLGPVRDLDVQSRRLRETGTALQLTEALVPYGAWLEDQRQRAQAELVEALQSQHYLGLAERLGGIDSLVIDPLTDRALYADAPQRLKRALKRLRKRADALDETAVAADLHAVRIRAKRLRYTVEFYTAAYGEPAQRLVESVVALQDLLGSLQDGVVSSQHIHAAIQTAAGTWPAETSLALGQTLQYDVQCGLEIRRGFVKAYRAVRGELWQRLKRAMRRAETRAVREGESPASSV